MDKNLGNNSTALIVDDEKDICFLLTGILRQKDISTNRAGSLAEAQHIIDTQSPSIIFLDNHLPDGLGLEYISTLKATTPDSKIIVITAHDNPLDREKAYREGADFFINKPFTKDIILRTIDNLNGKFPVE